MSFLNVVDFNFLKSFNFNRSYFTKNLSRNLSKTLFVALPILGSFFAYNYFRKKKSEIFFEHLNKLNATDKVSTWPANIIDCFDLKELGRDPEQFLTDYTSRVQGIYNRIFVSEQTPQLMGKVNWVPGNFGFWMGGVALTVAHLKRKYDFKDFYVCETLEGFSNQLKQFINDAKAKRGAFIVPCFGSDHGFRRNFPQHKVTVVVEKFASNQIKIALLDSQPIQGNSTVNSKNADEDDLWSGDYNPQELVFRAIKKAQLPPNTQLFHSGVVRELAYGCAIFAIRDAVAFLRDPEFFDKIAVHNNSRDLFGYKLRTIWELPPAYMVGTQSLDSLHRYIQNYKKQNKDLAVKLKKDKSKSLPDYMRKYSVNRQNHYVTAKLCKYSGIVLQLLTKMNPQAIDSYLSGIFVR